MLKTILIFLTVKGSVAACPDGWLTHGNSCYLFSHGTEDWPGSYEMCKIMGGHLVEIEDTAENNYINLQAKSGGTYWIGLTDASEEGSWVWMTSKTKITDQFTNWYPGEPTRYAGKTSENCVDFYVNSGKWNDAPCTEIHNYICEKTIESAEVIG